MRCDILEWPEPDGRLIRGSSGKSVGAHDPLEVEHYLELFECHPRFPHSHRRGIGQEKAADSAKVQVC